MLKYADVCRLTYAYVCSRMLTYAGEFLQIAYEEQYAASVERARNITPRRRFKCVSSFFSIFFPWRNITPRRSFKCVSSFFLFFLPIFCSWRNITPRVAASSASPPLSLSLSLTHTHTQVHVQGTAGLWAVA